MATENKMQAVFRSIEKNNGNTLKSLLDEGCDPDVCRRKTSALILAVVKNKLRCVKILISYHAMVDKKDDAGKTATMYACVYDRQDILAALFEAGADLKLAANDGTTACMFAAMHESHSCLSYIVEHVDIDINKKDLDGNTALMHAVKYGNSHGLHYLLEKGADINITNNTGQCPLDQAIYSGDLNAANFLIDKGASVNFQDNSGNTPLATAFEFLGHDGFQLIEQLLLKGAKPTSQMCTNTYLHEMIAKSQPQIIRLMVVNGFRPVVVKCTSEAFKFDCVLKPISPLCVAFLTNEIHIAKYLLSICFLTQFDIIELRNDNDVIEYLERHSYNQCLDLMNSMFSSPLNLVTHSFVTISDFMLVLHEKQAHSYTRYIEKLPDKLKRRLLFKSELASLCPNAWGNIELNFDSQFKYLDVCKRYLVSCNCALCSEIQGFKLHFYNAL